MAESGLVSEGGETDGATGAGSTRTGTSSSPWTPHTDQAHQTSKPIIMMVMAHHHQEQPRQGPKRGKGPGGGVGSGVDMSFSRNR